MKKLFAFLMIAAVMLSFSACGSKKDMSAEEYSKYVEAENSKQEAKSVKVEQNISKKMDNVSDKIGKTEKNKKVVLYKESESEKQYRVLYMKNGKGDYYRTYHFAKSIDDYSAIYKNIKADGKLIESDKNTRMVAEENGKLFDVDFEYFYKDYPVQLGWEVIE